MFPIQAKFMYIRKTVADSARGVESSMRVILPPALILSTKFDRIASPTNQVTIPGFRVIHM